MFQVNAKTDHGLLIMVELAKSSATMPLGPLAKRLGVSSAYLSQVAKSLQEAGLIASREGQGGGFYLKLLPTQIKIWDILQALNPTELRCHHLGRSCPNNRHCPLPNIWPVIIEDLEKSLKKRTLASLLKI